MSKHWAFLLIAVLACVSCLGYAAEGGSGRIEVEVVYKDTGEPVEGVLIELRHQGTPPRIVPEPGPYSSKEGQHTFDNVRFGPYDVGIRNAIYLNQVGSSRFYYAGSEVQKSVTVSQEEPAVQVRFEVERGWQLSGSVTRDNGSPLAGAALFVEQGEPLTENVYSVVGDDGRFEILGIAPGDTAQVGTYTTVESSGQFLMFIPIRHEEVRLSGESTCVDLKVATVPLDVNLDVVKALWPFTVENKKRDYLGLVWVGGKPKDAPKQADVRVPLTIIQAETLRGLPKERYKIRFKDLPANEAVTVGLGTRECRTTGSSPAGVHGTFTITYRSLRTVQLGTEPQQLTVTTYEPRALLSRIVVFGVPSVLVIVVLAAVLLRGARQRKQQ